MWVCVMEVHCDGWGRGVPGGLVGTSLPFGGPRCWNSGLSSRSRRRICRLFYKGRQVGTRRVVLNAVVDGKVVV